MVRILTWPWLAISPHTCGQYIALTLHKGRIERVYTLNLFNEYLPHFVLISDSDIEPDLNYNNDNEI